MASLPTLPKRYHNASIWALYGIGFIPAVWGFYLGATGQLPGNPVKEFEHLLGTWGLRFLLLTLAITPLRDVFGINWLRYRRALGLLAFYYVALHFLTYMVLDQTLNMQAVVQDIIRRPFITIGMGAFVCLIPLALTSSNFAIRKLGSRWGKLHRLAYPIAIAGSVHFAMSVKVITFEPTLYMALAFLLVGWRFVRKPYLKRRKAAAGIKTATQD